MFITTGVDLVRVDRLAGLAANERFLRRVFDTSELDDPRPAHLAGVFASKEAVFKALNVAPRWQSVTIVRGTGGRPRVLISTSVRPPRLRSVDVSISHEGAFAVAVAVAVFDDEARPS